MNIKEDIELILNCIEGFFVVDTCGRIIYMTDDVAKSLGYNDASFCVGEMIEDICGNYEAILRKVLETGKPQPGQILKKSSQTIICNAVPVHHNGDVVAAFQYDVFSEQQLFESFLEEILKISKELTYMEIKHNDIQNSKYTISDIIGKSKAIENLKKDIRKVAPSDASVLVQGETGTGKELIVHAIHNLSMRKKQNLIKINCSAIPENIFEAELFGYEDGSFTGADVGGRVGKIESANGGTLFLDEIGSMPLSVQPKLLRFLQEKEISRLGSSDTIPIDVRVVSATNGDLYEMVKREKFREDLYFRLNVMEINVPPLRKRKEDIEVISHVLLERINDDLERRSHRVEEISDEAMSLLISHDWPGNVRELHNTIENATNICYEKTLKKKYFIELLHKKETSIDSTQETFDLENIKNEAEKNAITKMLEYCKGNKSQVAEYLNISRQSLYNKMRKYNL